MTRLSQQRWVRTLLCAACGWTAAAAPLYQNDFSAAALDQVPEDFLVMDGQFAVKQEGDNKYLELPGSPLESFGFLFGPNRTNDTAVAARLYGTGKGRRFPVFAVSVGGVSGHKLQISPAKKAVELLRGERVLASAPFDWASGQWVRLRLQVRQAGAAEWTVEGKAWRDGSEEPKAWTLTSKDTERPLPGRPGAWGKPFADTPIRFDDLQVEEPAAN